MGAENGVERGKLSERERRGERACEKTMEREWSEERRGGSWNGNGAVSGLNWPLKGDMLLKLRNALQTLFYPMSKINYQPEF